jgi:hypothetical protein
MDMDMDIVLDIHDGYEHRVMQPAAAGSIIFPFLDIMSLLLA